MIINFAYLEKMLRNFFIFGLLFVAINADGKFSVLQSPESITFQGEDPISGQDVGEVVLAATGNTIDGSSKWTGLSIVDPFRLPTKAVIALIEGVSIHMDKAKIEFPLEGNGARDSLEELVKEMKATKTSVCDIDYTSKHAQSRKSHKCFGTAVKVDNEPELPKTTALSSEDPAALKFLTAIADLNDAVDNYLKMKDTKSTEPKSVIVVRMSLEPITAAHGIDSAQQLEAVKLLQNTLSKLQKAAADDSLFIAVSSTISTKSRSKRDAKAEGKNEYNLAKYYSSDYPVIFNIILWFMVVFGLSLLAISYAIGSMDPGKDSIIYRMTSTRMKKDN